MDTPVNAATNPTEFKTRVNRTHKSNVRRRRVLSRHHAHYPNRAEPTRVREGCLITCCIILLRTRERPVLRHRAVALHTLLVTR
ncbi:hypothetical protein M8J75_001422 [Diaphorina citri]|nr:hypothetical protein M8J75_001288 [Diaphorina citri]KAI5700631.1 hypothetical protein M8J75_001422 [Diaphorina citri]